MVRGDQDRTGNLNMQAGRNFPRILRPYILAPTASAIAWAAVTVACGARSALGTGDEGHDAARSDVAAPDVARPVEAAADASDASVSRDADADASCDACPRVLTVDGN